MKVADVQKAAAQFKVVHRAAIEALNAAMGLAEIEKMSKANQDTQEILEAASNCRVKLIEALYWYQGLHQILMVRTDEGREAMKKYAEDLAKAQKEAEEKKARESAAPAEGGETCPPQP